MTNPWQQQCLENIAKLGGTPCDILLCDEVAPYLHAVCNCEPPYTNGCAGTRTPGCCAYGGASPIFVMRENPCYCCCGGRPTVQSIATAADAVTPASDVRVGDTVRVALDPGLLVWEDRPVAFSAGVGALSVSDTFRIAFGDPAAPEVTIASPHQLFLVQGGVLKRAARLVPGIDALTRPDGSAASILDMIAGKFTGARHQVALKAGVATDPAGHLIVADGVVSGDYALQLADLDRINPAAMAPGHADQPECGTPAHDARQRPVTLATFTEPAGFTPLTPAPAPLASDATSFVTAAQAADIQDNAPSKPVHSGAGRDIVNYLFRLYTGFYPTITFTLDEGNNLPNAYIGGTADAPTVIVNGGLIRLDAMLFEGMALAIAHQIAVIQGTPPASRKLGGCRGLADYDAVLAVIPYAFFGPEIATVITEGVKQITSLFGFIDPANQGGKPGDRCDFIPIDCRIDTLNAAAVMKSLPVCAGGK